MRKSRLVRHLMTLKPLEWRSFLQYVASPYFNQNQRVLDLVTYLHDCAPDFPAEKLRKATVFNVLFPKGERPYSTQAVHDHFSLALRLLEGFFIQCQIGEEPQKLDSLLVQALQRRGLDDAFERGYEQFFNQYPQADTLEVFLYRFRLHLDAYTQAQAVRKKRAAALLDEAEASLNRYYLVSMLKIGAERLNRAKILQESSQVEPDPMMVAGLAHLEPMAEEPLLATYAILYELFAQPEDTDRYDRVIELLDGVAERFHREEAAEAYAFALNYAIRRFNEGDAGFISRIFTLYKRLLELDLLTQENGIFPHAMMKNIVTAGLHNKAYTWTREFIEEYKDKVDPERRNDVYAYNMAMYYFEQRDYREALRSVSQTRFRDVFYELGARTLQVKVYYEMEEDDSIGYLLKAFRAALKRNKAVSPVHFRAFDSFLRFVDKLYKLKMRKGTTQPETWEASWKQLQAQLDNPEEGIANARWLEEKLVDLRV